MKTKLFFFAMLCFNLSFSQQNQSFQNVITTISAVTPAAPNEIFRFRPGNVTQLDLGSGFGFTSDRWFSLGKVVLPSGNTAYGLRFQLPNKAVTFGYQNITSNNPRIEWIDTGLTIGDLEFRAANSFTSTTSTLVATMKKNGNTIFGNQGGLGNSFFNSKVTIVNDGLAGLYIIGNQSGNTIGQGIFVQQEVSVTANYGVTAMVDANDEAIGIRGFGNGTASVFEAAIYGNSQAGWAGYFDGSVFATGTYQGSDAKLKDNLKSESSVLEKLAQLQPVTYDYKKMSELNLPAGLQHGFVAQDLEIFFQN